jgi:hypothetical protein
MTTNSYSQADLKRIVNSIEELSTDEKKEVFKIFDSNQVKYTENNNGMYIIMSMVDGSVLEQVTKFLDFCKKNRDTLASMENAQMNEKDKIFGKNGEVIETNMENMTDSNVTVTKVTYQKELDKYGLNIVNTETEQDINLTTSKPKISSIKAKIIKNNVKTTPKSSKTKTKDKDIE